MGVRLFLYVYARDLLIRLFPGNLIFHESVSNITPVYSGPTELSALQNRAISLRSNRATSPETVEHPSIKRIFERMLLKNEHVGI